MRYFSVPADFKKETIDKYEKLNREYENSKVIETYGNITVGNLIGSGRSIDLIPSVDLDRLEEYVKYSKQKNINFNYTINTSHMQNSEFKKKEMLEIVLFLKKLYNLGIRSLTIALPSLHDIVKAMDCKFEIKTSVICQITNPNKAAAYKEMGVQRIVVDESIGRDFRLLKDIRAVFGDSVEIIANPICNKNCVYRMFHYNQISSDSICEISSEASANYYVHKCLLKRYKKIGNLLKINWIRPEDIKYYTEIGIKYFKLQGRDTLRKGDVARTVKHYFDESYDGNLLDLIDTFGSNSSFEVYIDNKKLEGFINPFFQSENFCKNNCSACNYCDTFAKKCIDEKKVKEVYELARAFIDEYDEFKGMINTLKQDKESVDSPKDYSMEADFALE